MDSLQATKVCEKLHLGALVANPQEVSGGLLHRMWRIVTSRGTFAVKQLNPERLRIPGARQRHRVTEQISDAFADRGLPAVTALRHGEDYLREIDGITVLIYPWIKGVVLPPDPVNPERCWQIGFALGRMHALWLRILDLEFTYAFPYPSFSDEHWTRLTQQACEVGMPRAGTIACSLSELIKYNAEYTRARKELRRITVVSHRDLDQKNVLWSDPLSFAIIDWEAAGLINPAMELVVVALNWSGLRAGQCQREALEAVIRGYHNAGGAVHTSARVALYGCVGKWLNWLEYNLQRSLKHDICAEELRIALCEIDMTLATLRLLESHIEEWTEWLELAALNQKRSGPQSKLLSGPQ